MELDEDTIEKLKEVEIDELSFGIILAIKLFQVLNQKQIAKLVGKPEATVYRRIKLLLTEKIIQLNQESTSSMVGKFYELTNIGKHLLRNTTGNTKASSTHKHETNEDKAITVKSSGILINNLTNLVSQGLLYQPKDELKKNSFESSFISLQLSTDKELAEFYSYLDDFLQKIEKFRTDRPFEGSTVLYLFHTNLTSLLSILDLDVKETQFKII